jgi:hypothetical protein
MTQVADEMQKARAQGLPESQVMQIGQQLAQQLLDQTKQEELMNRPADAPSTPQTPKGVTGQVQMSNMANGA